MSLGTGNSSPQPMQAPTCLACRLSPALGRLFPSLEKSIGVVAGFKGSMSCRHGRTLNMQNLPNPSRRTDAPNSSPGLDLYLCLSQAASLSTWARGTQSLPNSELPFVPSPTRSRAEAGCCCAPRWHEPGDADSANQTRLTTAQCEGDVKANDSNNSQLW